MQQNTTKATWGHFKETENNHNRDAQWLQTTTGLGQTREADVEQQERAAT